MKNMKVSHKLITSFLAVIVLSTIVGGVGIFGMYRINAADVALYQGNYLPTIMAGDISQHVIAQRMNLRSMILYDVNREADTFNKAKNGLTQSLTEMDSLLREYDGTIVNSEDRAAFDEFVSTYEKDWLPFVTELQALSTAGKGEESKALLSSAGPVATAAKLDELTSKLQQINISDGEISVNDNGKLFITMTVFGAAVLAVAIVIAMILAIYVSGLISKPLLFMKNVLYEMGARGRVDFTEEEYRQAGILAEAKDEAGQSIQMLINTGRRLEAVGKSMERIASGDLTEDLKLLSEADTLGNYMQKMMDNLSSMFSEINTASSQVSVGSKQIADGSQALAQGSTEQAAAVEQLSSSISEIAQKTKTNAAMAEKAAALANTIKGNAEKGSLQMNEMMSAVKEINEAGQNINRVIKVIDDIAFQTNILALNAAVEAARAGQHGKGFAVVAEEVRNLAAKSADAAKDTGSLIANSIEKAELGACIADLTAASLSEIVAGINESTQLVGDIAKSSDEQSAGITQINTGIDQVAQVVQQNSATAEESAAASEEMSSQSDMLQGLVAQFKIKGGGGRASGRYMQTSSAASSAPPRRLAMPEKKTYVPVAADGDYGKY